VVNNIDDCQVRVVQTSYLQITTVISTNLQTFTVQD